MTQASVIDASDWVHNQFNGAIAFMILATFFVILRTIGTGLADWKKRQHLTLFSWDNALILSSLVAFLLLCACAIVEAQAYFTYMSPTEPPSERKTHWMKIFKARYGFTVVYPIACALPKLSICYIYLGLFKVKASVQRTTYALIVFIALNTIAWLIPSIVVCQHISAYWGAATASDAHCIHNMVFETWISLPHIITDLIMLGLPLPLLWNMQMRRARKVGIILTFLTGSIGIIGGCLRLGFYIHETYLEPPHNELSKLFPIKSIVSYLESGMYLIAACLPRLRSLFSYLYSVRITPLYSLFTRSHNPKGTSPSDGSMQGNPNWKKRDLPYVETRLTGLGIWEPLKSDEEALLGSVGVVTRSGDCPIHPGR